MEDTIEPSFLNQKLISIIIACTLVISDWIARPAGPVIEPSTRHMPTRTILRHLDRLSLCC